MSGFFSHGRMISRVRSELRMLLRRMARSAATEASSADGVDSLDLLLVGVERGYLFLNAAAE